MFLRVNFPSLLALFLNDLLNSFAFLLQTLSALQVPLSDLLEILLEGYLLLQVVRPLFLLAEDALDVLLQLVLVADVDELQSVLNCDAPLLALVVHQELHQIEEVARLQTVLVEYASKSRKCWYRLYMRVNSYLLT